MIVKPKASFIGNPLLEYDSLESTNTFTQNLVSKSKPTEGTVVFTHKQTAGKGQYGRKWESKSGQNITLSIVLKPTFLAIKDQFYLNIVTSLAVANTIEHYIKTDAKIKWPNDIYIGDLKTCGILIQNNISASQLISTIVGIGLNVNQTSFDPNIPNPTSLKLSTHQEHEVGEVRDTLFGEYESAYLKLKDGDHEELMEAYQSRMYRIGVLSKFKIDEKIVEGKIDAINSMGQLVIEIDGRLESFSKTEIQYLK